MRYDHDDPPRPLLGSATVAKNLQHEYRHRMHEDRQRSSPRQQAPRHDMTTNKSFFGSFLTAFRGSPTSTIASAELPGKGLDLVATSSSSNIVSNNEEDEETGVNLVPPLFRSETELGTLLNKISQRSEWLQSGHIPSEPRQLPEKFNMPRDVASGAGAGRSPQVDRRPTTQRLTGSDERMQISTLEIPGYSGNTALRERKLQKWTSKLFEYGRIAINQENPHQHERLPATYGWDLEHRVLGPHDEEPIVVCNPLGHGSLGVVEEVRRRNKQLPTFVRKRVQLSARKLQAQATLKIIQEEAKNLRLLVHPHIVTLIGSYEEKRHMNRHFYCLLMSPVGDNDLKNFLDIAGEQVEQDAQSTLSTRWKGWIDTWFICLASALAYMHESGIRHQDIKPSNIIHRGDRVYFTDFSSSCAFEVGHTTSTENPSRASPMYAAPEVTDKYAGGAKRHGRASDIFALGCVFCDMLTVLTGRSVHSFHSFLTNSNDAFRADHTHTRGPLYYSHKIDLISSWFSKADKFVRHIAPMLESSRNLRPTAMDVLRSLAIDHILDDRCDCTRVEGGFETSARGSEQNSYDTIDIPCENGGILRLQFVPE